MSHTNHQRAARETWEVSGVLPGAKLLVFTCTRRGVAAAKRDLLSMRAYCIVSRHLGKTKRIA